MLLELRAGGEESCIEDAAIGTSTVCTYLYTVKNSNMTDYLGFRNKKITFFIFLWNLQGADLNLT